MSAISGRMAAIIGGTIIALLWIALIALASTTGLEVLWRYQKKAEDAAAADSRPRYDRLGRAYDPFHVQHLHPQYLFFFPLQPAARMALSNEICTVDGDGFRGPGPAHASGRRLAFLLGGSAAFGDYASSDATTITGYLNRIQDEYFFVNAGVPSWNSTQEMFRLTFQILDYRPALVMTFDGSNDAELLLDYSENGMASYAIGAPDSFHRLVTLVDDIRANFGKLTAISWLETMFPEVTKGIKRRLKQAARSARARDGSEGPALISENVLHAAAAKYLSNLKRMHNLAAAEGTRFIAVFQPVSRLHQHVDPKFEPNEEERDAVERFHKAVMEKYAHDFEFHDLAKVFDQYYAAVPVIKQDLTDETVFVDQVHLYDPGNEIIARHLSRLIRSGRARDR